jgi:hypothetical protein
MDPESGQIRETTPEEPLAQGEVEITAEEARVLSTDSPLARAEHLRKMRAKALRRTKSKSARKTKKRQRR